MNALSFGLLMRKRFGASLNTDGQGMFEYWRWSKNGQYFMLKAVRGWIPSQEGQIIDEITFIERVMPDDDHGNAKNVVMATTSTRGVDGDTITKWIVRQMIQATLRSAP